MRLLLIITLMPALTGCVGAPDRGQSPGSPRGNSNRSPIEVNLLPPSSPIEVGTRAVFTFRITNVSTNAVDLPWPGFIDGFIQTDVRGPQETRLQLRGRRLSLGHGRYPGGDIQPGKSMETELSCVFPVPGRYTTSSYLQTSRAATPWWSFWEGRVDADDVVVTVVEKRDDNKPDAGDGK